MLVTCQVWHFVFYRQIYAFPDHVQWFQLGQTNKRWTGMWRMIKVVSQSECSMIEISTWAKQMTIIQIPIAMKWGHGEKCKSEKTMILRIIFNRMHWRLRDQCSREFSIVFGLATYVQEISPDLWILWWNHPPLMMKTGNFLQLCDENSYVSTARLVAHKMVNRVANKILGHLTKITRAHPLLAINIAGKFAKILMKTNQHVNSPMSSIFVGLLTFSYSTKEAGDKSLVMNFTSTNFCRETWTQR